MRNPFPRLCYITDRLSLTRPSLEQQIEMAAKAGVDVIQIREKDLPVYELLELVISSLELTRDTATRIVVNDRLDVALACGAGGVHLGSQSMPPARVQNALKVAGRTESFWVGVSCHSVNDVRAAEGAGASYALLGPIFDTPSKRIYGPALGFRVLEQAARSCRLPLFALGGITPERALACIEAGASGIAGI